MSMKRINSERLVIAMARYRRAKRALVMAMQDDCPDAAIVHRRSVYRLECDASGTVRLRESSGVRLAVPRPRATESEASETPQS